MRLQASSQGDGRAVNVRRSICERAAYDSFSRRQVTTPITEGYRTNQPILGDEDGAQNELYAQSIQERTNLRNEVKSEKVDGSQIGMCANDEVWGSPQNTPALPSDLAFLSTEATLPRVWRLEYAIL